MMLLPVAGLLMQACSDPKNAPTEPENKVSVHGTGWMNPTSDEFHGKVLSAQNYKTEDCRPCHGSQYDGGITGESCKKCHTTFPHPTGWQTASSPEFHGKLLAVRSYNLSECQICHGNNFDGGTSGVSCRSCHASYPHTADWLNPNSANNHGAVLAAQNYNAQACQACHGSDYNGGTSKISCRTCHASYPHSAGWQNTTSSEFHGKVLAAQNYNVIQCQVCHGNNFDGGTSGVSCRSCHASYPHTADWLNPNSANNHGAVLAAQNYDAQACQLCHGSDLNGGTSNVSCRKCHASYPHPENWVAGATSHYVFLKSNAFDLASCQSCHGQNYGTMKGNTSCLTCHTKQGGPEACNVCHGNASGDVNDLTTWAPPKGLDDETAISSPAVGAHQAHLNYYSNLPARDVCQECHVVPNAFATPNHVDDNNRAEAVFGPLGALITEGGSRVPNVIYDFNANTCSASYCHGNWGMRKALSRYDFIYSADVMSGSSATPQWTDGNPAACGSCHGLPPTGHNPFGISACMICHQGVVDETGAITDKAKHINGKVNVFQEEYPMP